MDNSKSQSDWFYIIVAARKIDSELKLKNSRLLSKDAQMGDYCLSWAVQEKFKTVVRRTASFRSYDAAKEELPIYEEGAFIAPFHMCQFDRDIHGSKVRHYTPEEIGYLRGQLWR